MIKTLEDVLIETKTLIGLTMEELGKGELFEEVALGFRTELKKVETAAELLYTEKKLEEAQKLYYYLQVLHKEVKKAVQDDL
jgi:hypothetical protein